ncbi:hypothetical protein S7711_08010 [Stachybotrys chartarum IBT 7711]|uniref:Flo11 n=1 Tax=Stachybotrys chartarum (strain CBS 109288 / IBT 7711) TaxID=1280523 RepID=A0A084ATB4_STACB|nr:hypothetical protein S7711_08010 [Stachybotrys chartarum IBT 7711]
MASSAADVSATMSRPPSGIFISPRPMRSRTQSISSDRPSTIGHGLMSPPLSVSPDPAFIAASAASQIVTNDHDSHADMWYDDNGIEPSGDAALVSPGALVLVNNFLDQLLFNFLQVARGTTLSALRPAVSEVLKPKLAKDAINNADEELCEYLGGADEDDYAAPVDPVSPRDWDLELAWKRTRLRCMVYSSLGDMEEEDEDLYMEKENLEIGVDDHASTISPAVAIFLTSVLEYMGELTLTVAGQAAYQRIRHKFEKEMKEGIRSPSDVSERVVLEDVDMERVALDRTLGRLWRGWKKKIRSPTIDFGSAAISRHFSAHGRQDGITADTPGHKPAFSDASPEPTRPAELVRDSIAEDVSPTDIALPQGPNDVAEIEVPGLVVHSDDEGDEPDEKPDTLRRPRSLHLRRDYTVESPGVPRPAAANTRRSSSVPSRRRMSQFYPTEAAPTTDSAEPGTTGPDSAAEPVVDHRSPVEAKPAEPLEAFQQKTGPVDRRRSSVLPPTLISDSVAAGSDTNANGQARTQNGVATYEKAEIMTSSRVSIAGSSSTSLSEMGRPFSIKRSSSVHSARIIDVAGPRSPTISRDPSLDPNERVRPVSLSRASSISTPSNPEDIRRPRALEPVPRTSSLPSSRSPIDRVRPSLQNAQTISESEEEDSAATSPLDVNVRAMAMQPSWAPINYKDPASPPPPTDLVYSAATSTPRPTGPSVQTIRSVNEEPPEIPRKAPGHVNRHSSRKDSLGPPPAEESMTLDSEEEETTLPLQSNVPSRQTHTSSSSTPPATNRLKAIRTSEDNASSRAEDVARNFEELIQSNQTITYTLTPENMRDIDSKRSLDSPVVTKSWKNEDGRSHGRSRSSGAVNEIKRSPMPLAMHPVSEELVSPTGAVSRSPVAAPQILTRASSQRAARDARAGGESTADFAAFLKSTGPPGEKLLPPIRTANNGMASAAYGGSEARRLPTHSSRSRYQPRDAAVDTRGDSSDLIDFIRNGPPSAANNPRIPRHVAPFRTTMDSDQLAAVVAGKPMEASIPEVRTSQASTSITDASMHSSANSTSALIKSKTSPMPSNMGFDDEDMMPKRKTRRVRDPYAIDYSDEEMDEGSFSPAAKPPAKEESLAEFLRNYAPPPEPERPPQKLPKKKASAPSLIGRFTRSSSSSNNAAATAQATSPTDSRSLSSRAGIKGHIPIQVNMPAGYDKYGRTVDAGSSRPRMAPSSTSTGKAPTKKYEAREAVSSNSRTADLASFLRDSGPPHAELDARAHSPIHYEEPGGLAKVFGRRRKTPLY